MRARHNYAEMLEEDYADKLGQAGKDKLATLGRLSRHMGELLDSLLAFSRLGHTDFSNTDVDLNLVVSQALELLQTRVQSCDVSIRIPRSLPMVKGDRMRLVEVFMNLISNGIKYNDKTDKVIEIGFEASPLGSQPVL